MCPVPGLTAVCAGGCAARRGGTSETNGAARASTNTSGRWAASRIYERLRERQAAELEREALNAEDDMQDQSQLQPIGQPQLRATLDVSHWRAELPVGISPRPTADLAVRPLLMLPLLFDWPIAPCVAVRVDSADLPARRWTHGLKISSTDCRPGSRVTHRSARPCH
jgi:hypothetical protein